MKFHKGQINKDDPATALAIGKALEEMFPGYVPVLILCNREENPDGGMSLDQFTISNMPTHVLADFFDFMAKSFRDGDAKQTQYQ